MSRRGRKLLRKKGKKYHSDLTIEDGDLQKKQSAQHTTHTSTKKKKNKFLEFYEHKYKKSMWFTIILLILSILIISAYTMINGEFIPRGVSLKGGVTITVPSDDTVDIEDLRVYLKSQFPQASISTRSMMSAGATMGFIVDASDVDPELLLKEIQSHVGSFEKFSLETMGSALGDAFFKQTLLALLIAFVLMSIVVFLAFKTFIPSFAVILSAVSDLTMTVAAIDLLGIRIETAGVAALLMLIGYSVDTDILLTTRVIKREEGTVFYRVMGAMKTGMTMTLTSIAAISVSLIFTQSETLRQIMLILLIGLIFDIPNTWIQNVGILRIYLERKAKKKAKNTLAEYADHEIVDAEFEEEKTPSKPKTGKKDNHKKSYNHHKVNNAADHTEHIPKPHEYNKK